MWRPLGSNDDDVQPMAGDSHPISFALNDAAELRSMDFLSFFSHRLSLELDRWSIFEGKYINMYTTGMNLGRAAHQVAPQAHKNNKKK